MNQLQILLSILCSGDIYQSEYNTDRTVTVTATVDGELVNTRVDESAFVAMKEAVHYQQGYMNRRMKLNEVHGGAQYAMTADVDLNS